MSYQGGSLKREKEWKADKRITKKMLVAMRLWETPVPIPNTKVKTYPAEDTAGATLWESRWPPN